MTLTATIPERRRRLEHAFWRPPEAVFQQTEANADADGDSSSELQGGDDELRVGQIDAVPSLYPDDYGELMTFCTQGLSVKTAPTSDR
jgi:hypothetical protein